MTNIDHVLERIARVIRDPNLRTGNGLSFPVLSQYPPIERDMIASAEARLGFELPELLRQCYLKIGNRGCGPAHGIIGLLDGGYQEDLSSACVVELYEYYREASDNPWPKGALPVFVMGCGMVDSVDCLNSNHPVLSMENDLRPTGVSFDDYILQWLTEMETRQTYRRL